MLPRLDEPVGMSPGAPAPSGYIVGAGAEQTQQPRPKARLLESFGLDVTRRRLSGRGVNRAHVDGIGTPQPIPVHPRIEELVLDAAVGVETGTPRLPGRLAGVAWDGEPGFGSPTNDLR